MVYSYQQSFILIYFRVTSGRLCLIRAHNISLKIEKEVVYYLGNIMSDKEPIQQPYTCSDYRMEMRLLGVRQQLLNPDLSDVDRKKLQEEIDTLEKELDML